MLFQWTLPEGVVQVTRRDSFPPAGEGARVAHLGAQPVPYAVIREARQYLRRQEHVHAQEAVIQQAMNRLIAAAKVSEGRVQAALAKAGLQQR